MASEPGAADLSAAVEIGGLRFVPMIAAAQIAAAVARIAGEIAARHQDANPVVVGVLNGAALFHADLVRQLAFPLEIDYIRVASYHGGLESSGRVNFTAAPGTQSAGRNVIVVEDIVDTGRTVQRLREFFATAGAASVEVAALLYKRDADLIGRRPEYLGFEIEDRFVVGYGLDYMEHGRNLPSVYVLDTPAGPHNGAAQGATRR